MEEFEAISLRANLHAIVPVKHATSSCKDVHVERVLRGCCLTSLAELKTGLHDLRKLAARNFIDRQRKVKFSIEIGCAFRFGIGPTGDGGFRFVPSEEHDYWSADSRSGKTSDASLIDNTFSQAVTKDGLCAEQVADRGGW